MAESSTQHTVESVAEILLQRFDTHVAALMAYGSRVFGQARVGSAFDYWLIVRDREAFHRQNAEFYRTQLNVPSTPEAQIALNESGPIFYALMEGDIEIKFAVMDEARFAALCRSSWWTVKGRMQKPMRVIRSSPVVDEAILAARREGLAAGVNLVPAEFTMEELLYAVVSLSYRAEIRPERKGAKIRSILEAARRPLEEIYRPLLAEMPFIETSGERFIDRRTASERRKARRATLRALRRSKWSRESLAFIWRNFCSHPEPLRYIFMKIVGEVQKPISRFLARRRAARRE